MISQLVTTVVLLLAAGFGTADQDRLQGEWIIVSVELGGKKTKGDKDGKVVVKGNQWTAPSGGTYQFQLDSSKNPKHIDMIVNKNGMAVTWPGIFKIEGDTLTFCLPVTIGGARPTEFKGDEKVYLMVGKRATK